VSADRLSLAPVSTSGIQPAGQERSSLERMKADELAREFESMLLLQMLRQMRQSMTDGTEQDKGLSADTMIDMVDSELARQLSRQGGFGLARLMREAIERHHLAGAEPSEPSGSGPASHIAATPYASKGPEASGGDSRRVSVDDHKVTSAFGWRPDPFTGAPRYHHGIDFKAAYGELVPAAGAGRVVEAGERGAYGLSVVVEHPDGLRTRYAHLASLAVAAGDRVLQGQELGRVGQSGRATGPHLHFEVIRDGQRVDPARVIALEGSGLGGLKLAGEDADSTIGGRVLSPAMSGADDED